MTNPNDAIGTNGAFGGRTSVNAFNDVLGAFQSRGVLSGWGIAPSSGMTVACGGNGTTRDVAVAEDTNGNKTTVNNISGSPVNVTLDSAPASNSRYDAIVVYVDKPPTGNATQDNPECCGIIKVTGTAASTPAYPNDSAIRSAITADGASGATAYYAVIGYVLVASGTTTITSGMIKASAIAKIASDNVDWTTFMNLSKKTISSVSLTANTWATLGTITLRPSKSGIITAFAQVGNASAGGRLLIRIVSSGGTVHGSSSAALNTSGSTRVTTSAMFLNTSSSTSTWTVDVQSTVAISTTLGELAIMELPACSNTPNLIS